jgi:hypothetical protein
MSAIGRFSSKIQQSGHAEPSIGVGSPQNSHGSPGTWGVPHGCSLT